MTGAVFVLGVTPGVTGSVRWAQCDERPPGPSLAWVPLLVLWLGIGEGPRMVLIAIGAFLPVYTTVHNKRPVFR